MTVDGVTITVDGNGGRQALYNEDGVVTITGGSVLTSIATQRPAVTNKADGTMTILDATIISSGAQGLINEGVLTLGSNDGAVNITPVIQGNHVWSDAWKA